MHIPAPTLAFTAFAVSASAVPAQDLRRAAATADVVVIARADAGQPFGEHLVLHRLAAERALLGDPTAPITVVVHTALSEHQRPTPGERRLYCLLDFSAGAASAGLPAASGPFFKMSGFAGSNPAVAATDDPGVELAQIVLAAQAGGNPRATLDRLLAVALGNAPSVRTEAVQVLGERAILRDALNDVQSSQLLSRAVAETDDVPYKIALAELCAERRMPGLVEALCLSVREVEDRRFAEVLGRIAVTLHGEGAVDVLRPFILQARDAGERGRLVLALGATATNAALGALLRMHAAGPDEWVDAALRLHGAPRALEAAGDKKH